MGGINASLRTPASRSRRKNAGKTGQAPAPAQVMPHTPAHRAGKRTWTPKELAGELAEAFGVPVCERNIVRRCNLPPTDPAHISTLPAFPGRHYIPASEVIRLLATEVAE